MQEGIEESQNKKKKWRKGLIWVGVFVAVFIVFFLLTKDNSDNRDNNSNEGSFFNQADEYVDEMGSGKAFQGSSSCRGEGTITFNRLPMDEEDYESYIPYGLMIDSHVTPIDHSYFSPMDYNSPRDAYEVYAIADGDIVEIQYRRNMPGEEKEICEYRIVIQYTCTFFSYFDLITSLDDEIYSAAKEDLEGKGFWSGVIPVKSGQLVGRIGGQTLDFGVYNDEVTLDFVNPDSYISEPWKIHTDDPFLYFTEPELSILKAKNLRKVEPISGKIDYDIEGKLVGNWFLEGTNGYQGSDQNSTYYYGHLSIVYNHLDPDRIIISTGNYQDEPLQATVAGNSPDPKSIGIESGLAKYELVQFEYTNGATGESWDRTSLVDNIEIKEGSEKYGIILFEVLEDNKLKVEIFTNKTHSQVTGFTEAASIYTR